MRRIGQYSHHHPLDRRVQQGAGDQRGEQSESSVPPGILRLAQRSERSFEAAIGEDQKQAGFQPGAGSGAAGQSGRSSVASEQIERTRNRHQKQRHQFRHREHVADLRARPHPAIVDQRQDAIEKGQDKESRKWFLGVRPELATIDDEQVGGGSGRSQSHQPKHPAHFDSNQTAECGASVQIRTAGLGELRSHLGETGHDDARRRPRQQDRPGTGPANEPGDVGRQSKNSTADDRVDHQRRQAPSSNGAHQSGLFAAGQDVVVSQDTAVSYSRQLSGRRNVGASVPLVLGHSRAMGSDSKRGCSGIPTNQEGRFAED